MTTDDELLDTLARTVTVFDFEVMKCTLRLALESGIPVDIVIKKGLGRGMEIVGEKYEKGEYFLSDLIMSAEVMNEAIEQLKPLLGNQTTRGEARILIGTVEGDLHDIGKNLVKYMLQSAGLDVIDLGVDVTPSKFVDQAKMNAPDMVCMSALLSVTAPKVGQTIEALDRASLKDRLKILIGGRCLSEEIAAHVGADGYGKDCYEGLRKAKELLRRS